MEETLSMARDIGRSPGLTSAIAPPGMVSSAAMVGVRLRRVFAGEASQLAGVRDWLASLLPPGEVRNDVIIIATELGSNAIKHTASGQGGSFGVELTCNPFVVRVAVSDGGGSAEPRVVDDPAAEHGRGLLLVRGLAEQTGMSGDYDGRVVWADVAWYGLKPSGICLRSVPGG